MPATWPELGQRSNQHEDAPRRRAYPPADWPTAGQLSYTKELITVFLLLLALPWLVRNLIKRPGVVLQGAAKKHAVA